MRLRVVENGEQQPDQQRHHQPNGRSAPAGVKQAPHGQPDGNDEQHGHDQLSQGQKRARADVARRRIARDRIRGDPEQQRKSGACGQRDAEPAGNDQIKRGPSPARFGANSPWLDVGRGLACHRWDPAREMPTPASPPPQATSRPATHIQCGFVPGQSIETVLTPVKRHQPMRRFVIATQIVSDICVRVVAVLALSTELADGPC